MLECDDPREVVADLWTKLGSKIEITEEFKEFFALKGPSIGSMLRQHIRYNFRQKALLIHRGVTHAVYSKDISHSSLGFLHFEQLYPLERVRFYLAEGTKFDLTICRCLRLNAHCFECGGYIDQTDRLTTRQLCNICRVD
jgi:hypothetical protein